MIPNGTQLGAYLIERPLCETGGMANVYLASLPQDRSLQLAIKIAKSDSNGATPEGELLQREAEFLKLWDRRHPGIVRIFPIRHQNLSPQYTLRASVLPEEPWYMLMEYLSGLSLAQNLNKIAGFPLEWKLELFYQILLPIAFLHEKGYAHRDLKPDNIVFREPIETGRVPQPVLVDFALVSNGTEGLRFVDSSYTLEYAAPERVLRSFDVGDGAEQTEGNPLPHDIWSLGIILYEILTGRLLLKGNREKVRTTIIKEKLEPELPGGDARSRLLTAFIRNLLRKDPADRPTIKQVIYALEEKFLPPRVTLKQG